MALRSSFCEPSPNGFCTQELKSPAQTVITKPRAWTCSVNYHSQAPHVHLEKRRHFYCMSSMLGTWKDREEPVPSLALCLAHVLHLTMSFPPPGHLFAFLSARKSSLSTQVPYSPFFLHQCGSHLSVICHHPPTLSPGRCPLLSWPPNVCIIFLPVM